MYQKTCQTIVQIFHKEINFEGFPSLKMFEIIENFLYKNLFGQEILTKVF